MAFVLDSICKGQVSVEGSISNYRSTSRRELLTARLRGKEEGRGSMLAGKDNSKSQDHREEGGAPRREASLRSLNRVEGFGRGAKESSAASCLQEFVSLLPFWSGLLVE